MLLPLLLLRSNLWFLYLLATINLNRKDKASRWGGYAYGIAAGIAFTYITRHTGTLWVILLSAQ